MPNTVAQMVASARDHIRNLTPTEVADLLGGTDTVLVDIREPGELTEHGLIDGAIHAPRGMLEFWCDTSHPAHRPEFDPSRQTILYCASGGRSALAAETLHQLGYRDVAHLDGGIQAWKQAGLPVTGLEA